MLIAALPATLINAPAWAQPDEGDTDVAADADGSDTGAGPAAADGDGGDDALVCEGNWRYELHETRSEIGPARFARQRYLQRDIAMAAAAFGYCEATARNGFAGAHAASVGPCHGLLPIASHMDLIASNLFRAGDSSTCQCFSQPFGAGGKCEGLREQLPTLRRYDHMLVARAELVLAYQVCASPERQTNSGLRAACGALEAAVAAEHSAGGDVALGQFVLAAPLPRAVANAIAGVRVETDGRFLSVLHENFIGVRESICQISVPRLEAAGGAKCSVQVLGGDKARRPPGDGDRAAKLWRDKQDDVLWGMCNELALADVNAQTCRQADVYIDERGELHLADGRLTTRAARKDATLCIDISDFDAGHPLMVTLGLDPTGSVPERVWPGETMQIGALVDRPVTPEDVLDIHVLGKPRGVSLAEVLRVNGVPGYTQGTEALRATRASQREACRIARGWVPVVDHEVPIGSPDRQAIIPIEFDRGRDGETQPIDDGDYVVLWVRDIEPAGAVLVEYADGQTVGHEPSPLLGAPPESPPPTTEGPDGLLAPVSQLRGGTAGVDLPLLPRRARYPGSRVLRLGKPEGNKQYDLRVCTRTGGNAPLEVDQGGNARARSCRTAGGEVIVDEKMYVHGVYRFGVSMYFGYSYFPISSFVARRTPAAQAAGDNVFEVVETSAGTADYDVAVLLSVYPFGRDPRRFSLRPWRSDYWGHAALLAGFTVRSLEPWRDFYGGASLPIANGVSVSALAHFSRRDVPVGVRAGDLFQANPAQGVSIEAAFDTQSSLAVGVSVGLTVDYSLFERAFVNIWERLSGRRGRFLSGASRDETGGL